MRIIAPKLVIHTMPVPDMRYVNQPSPENIILLRFWLLYSLTTRSVQARNASLPTVHCSEPVNRSIVMSPSPCGASSSSPGPVKCEVAICPPAISFFIENFISPFSVMVGDMAIMAPEGSQRYGPCLVLRERGLPGLTITGAPMASCTVSTVFESRWLMR